MHRADMRTNIRLELSATSSELSDAEVNRSVSQAVAELSRFSPREVVKTIRMINTVADEAFTSDHDTAVQLTNQPIEWHSETVKEGSTERTRDTDYWVDYIDGSITVLSTGSMADSASCTISYTRSKLILNIASEFTNPIVIRQVEYPVGQVPQSFASYERHGDYLTLTNIDFKSQERTIENNQVVVWYHSLHTDPADSANGTFERFLDEVIVNGAAGFCCRIEATQRKFQSATDLASASTAISSSNTATASANTAAAKGDDESAAAKTALTAVATSLTAITTALVAMRGSAGEPVDDAKTLADNADKETKLIDLDIADAHKELKAAATALDKVTVHTTGGSDSIDDELDNIAADLTSATNALAAMRGSVGEPINDADVALDKVATHAGTEADAAIDKIDNAITASSDSVDDILDEVAALIASADTDLAAVTANMETDTRSADGYLDSGDALLNTVTVGGQQAVQDYAVYAGIKVEMAATFVRSALGRIGEADVRIREAAQRFNIVQGRVQEGVARINMARAFVEEAQVRVTMGQTIVNEAAQQVNIGMARMRIAEGRKLMVDSFVAEAQSRISEAQNYMNLANARLGKADRYLASSSVRIQIAGRLIQEGEGYFQQAQGYLGVSAQRMTINESYISQSQTYLNQAQAYLSQAQAYRTSAEEQRALSETWNSEADRRIGEFRNTLRTRETTTQSYSASRHQYTQ